MAEENPSAAGGDSGFNLQNIVNTLGTAGVMRLASEINRPANTSAARSPSGLLGNIGSVGMKVGLDDKTLLYAGVAVAVVALYFLTRK